MEKFVLTTLTFLALGFLAACSGAEVAETAGIDSNTSVSGNYSVYTADKIEGSGTLRFAELLPISSNRSMHLKASLDSTLALSSLTVIFYSSNALMPSNNGLAVALTRSGANVDVQISFNSSLANVSSSKLAFYFPTDLDLIIEFHNVNSKARVLVWRKNMVQYAAANADIDTDRSGDLDTSLASQNGAGSYVGLILKNATVTTARIETQKILD